MTPGQCDCHRVTRSFELTVATDEEHARTREDVCKERDLRRGWPSKLLFGPDDEIRGTAEIALDGLTELRDLAPINAPHSEDVDVAIRPIGCGCERSEHQCDADLLHGRESGCELLKRARGEAERGPEATRVGIVEVDGPESEVAESPTRNESFVEQVGQSELRGMDVMSRSAGDLTRVDLRPGQCGEQAEDVRCRGVAN